MHILKTHRDHLGLPSPSINCKHLNYIYMKICTHREKINATNHRHADNYMNSADDDL